MTHPVRACVPSQDGRGRCAHERGVRLASVAAQHFGDEPVAAPPASHGHDLHRLTGLVVEAADARDEQIAQVIGHRRGARRLGGQHLLDQQWDPAAATVDAMRVPWRRCRAGDALDQRCHVVSRQRLQRYADESVSVQQCNPMLDRRADR